MKNILVTGGLGYIWSHMVTTLVEQWYDAIILDNLSNSSLDTLEEIKKITGQDIPFIQGDTRDEKILESICTQYTIDAVMHFAGAKSVGESCENPWFYFDNNVHGTIQLLNVMQQYGIKNIIFSSTCVVYGSSPVPFTEETPTGDTTNPYATSKWLCEKLLQDYVRFVGMKVISLRYFNPIGNHPTGIIYEKVSGRPNNIFPFILKVLTGELSELSVFGNDYPTKDGTGIRDYIDIMDLVDWHIAALQYISSLPNDTGFFDTFNLGTGKGSSVLELVQAVEEVAQTKIPYHIKGRRSGDIAVLYTSVEKAKKILWREAKYTIEDSIRNALKTIRN